MKRLLTPLVLLSLVSSSAAVARSPQTPQSQDGSAAKPDAARAELEKKALDLLEDALAGAQGLRLAENRVRVQTIAAGLLWSRDERAARADFKAAADGIAALNIGLDPEDPQFFNTAQAVMQMRTELVQTVAQHDPVLALDFLRATRQPHPEAFQSQGNWMFNQEQMLEANLAGQIAAQDPQKAFKVAEETLSRGVTTGLLDTLRQLNAKDPASASKLVADIVQKLRPEDLRENGESSGVALQLLAMTRPAEASPSTPQTQALPVNGAMIIFSEGPGAFTSTDGARSPNTLSIEQQTRADLIEKIITAAMSVQPNRGGTYPLYNALKELMPELEKSAPERVAALRQRVAALESGFNPQGDVWKPYQELMQKGTVEAMLEAAPKAPAEVRDNLYMNAAWKAFNDGNDPERARQIMDNISNPQQRAQGRKSIEQQMQSRAAQQGNYAEARQMASRLTNVEEKVGALVQIAGAASSRGDKQTALQVLAEARGLLDGQAHNYAQFSAWLQIADAYAALDADTSFAMIESAIGQLNELVDAAAVVNGFGQESFKDGELRLQGGYPWGEMIGQCATTLALLAPYDFERASADAKRFMRPDTRSLAELLLAQNLLNTLKPPQRKMLYRRVQTGVVIDGIVAIDGN
ncbi:MAG TPA: hypothetical protein VHU19_18290 [Pyrinomonadaceae bacterium]|nr:hypothetical protein [Pyrinomonadaceae bacterium]